MVARYYRGRMTIDYLLKAPLGILHYFYYMAVIESQSDEGKKQKQNEVLEDAFEGG